MCDHLLFRSKTQAAPETLRGRWIDFIQNATEIDVETRFQSATRRTGRPGRDWLGRSCVATASCCGGWNAGRRRLFQAKSEFSRYCGARSRARRAIRGPAHALNLIAHDDQHALPSRLGRSLLHRQHNPIMDLLTVGLAQSNNQNAVVLLGPLVRKSLVGRDQESLFILGRGPKHGIIRLTQRPESRLGYNMPLLAKPNHRLHRDVLIHHNPHAACPGGIGVTCSSARLAAYSSAAMMSSRFRLGYASSNPSTVSPFASMCTI